MMNDSVPGFDGARKRIKEQGLDQLALAYQQKGQPSTSHATLAKLKQKVMVICSDQDLEILFLGLFI